MPSIASINIGHPEKIAAKSGMSGINKRPVNSARIGELGLDDDAVLDRKHHGGRDQAVYCYLESDYAWWAEELGEALPPGKFGENLTIAGLDGRDLSVGDRLRIGEVDLEITSHRTPCTTFAAQMGDAKWVRRFHKALRPGAYLRVLKPGTVHSGDTIAYIPFAGEKVRVSALMALDGRRELDRETMEWALRAPVHYKMRDDFEARLAALG